MSQERSVYLVSTFTWRSLHLVSSCLWEFISSSIGPLWKCWALKVPNVFSITKGEPDELSPLPASLGTDPLEAFIRRYSGAWLCSGFQALMAGFYFTILSGSYCISRAELWDLVWRAVYKYRDWTGWVILFDFIRLLILHACGDKPRKSQIILYNIQAGLATAINTYQTVKNHYHLDYSAVPSKLH